MRFFTHNFTLFMSGIFEFSGDSSSMSEREKNGTVRGGGLTLSSCVSFGFCSPELKAQVSFSDHLSSVVCLSVRPSVCLKTFHIFIFFSRTTGPISTKLGTKHPWVKGIQIYSNEGPRSFPMGDNYEIAKIH